MERDRFSRLACGFALQVVRRGVGPTDDHLRRIISIGRSYSNVQSVSSYNASEYRIKGESFVVAEMFHWDLTPGHSLHSLDPSRLKRRCLLCFRSRD